MGSLQILQVDPSTIEAAEGIKIDMPCVGYVGMVDGEVVGSGGLAWSAGRCWIWFKIKTTSPSYALPIYHKTKELLAKANQLGESAVFSPRDSQYPTSKKLLTVLGFSLFAIENGVEIWRLDLPRIEMVG